MRGPMRILRSLPVLAVETRVFVWVSAERLTVMEGSPVMSTSSHLRAASSPWRIPVLSASVISASSRVPTAARKSLEASSWDRDLMGDCPHVAAFFTRLAGVGGISPSSTAWLSAVERTPCITPTVLGFRPSSILRALKARTWATTRSRSRSRPKNGIRWLRQVRS